MRLWLKIAAIGFGAVLLLTVVTVAAGVMYVRTEAGAAWLGGTIGKSASSADQRIDLIGLRGALPFDAHVQRITISDSAGAWLTIDDAVLLVDPWSLLHGVAHIETIGARRIEVVRSPNPASSVPPSKSANAGQSFSLPKLPVAIELDTIAVERIEIAPAVAGQAMTLGLNGSVDLAGGLGRAHLDLRRLDAAGDLALSAAYGGPSDALTLELHGSEPSGVLLADLTSDGQKRPLRIDLTGSGSLADWRGKLTAAAGDDSRVDAAIGVKRGTTALDLSLGADVAVARLLPETMRAPVGDSARLDLAASIEDAGAIVLSSMKLAAGAGTVDASGRYAGASGDLAAHIAMALDLAPLGALASGETHGKVDATLVASGTVQQPQAKLTLNGSDIAAAGSTLSAATLAVEMAPAGDRIGIAGTGRFDGFAATGVPANAGLGDRIDLKFDAASSTDYRKIELTQATLSGAGLNLTANGGLDGGAVTLHGKLDAADLGKFASLAGLPLGGAASLTIDGSSSQGQSVDAKLTAGFQKLHLGIPAAEALLGPEGSLSLTMRRDAAGTLNLSDLKLIAADVSANGSFAYDPAAAKASGQVVVAVPQLAPIGRATGSPMAGSLNLNATGSGDRANLKLTGEGLAVGVVKIDRLDTAVAIPDLKQKSATVAASISRETTTAHLDARIDQPGPGIITIPILTLKGPATTVTANLLIDAAHRLADGKIDAKISNLAAWEPIIGQALGGSIDATVGLHAVKGAHPTEHATVRLQAQNLVEGAGKGASKLASAHLDADLDDVAGTPTGHADLMMTGGKAAGAVVETLHFDGMSQRAGNFSLALETHGSLSTKPLNLATKGTVTFRNGDQTLALSQLDLRLGDLGAHLEHPLTAGHSGAAFRIDDLALAIANGRIAGNAAYDGRKIAASIKANSLAIGTFAKLAGRGDAAGSLSFDLTIDGPLGGPQGQADLKLAGFAFGNSAGQKSVPIDLAANASLSPNAVALRAHVAGPKGEAALDLDGTVPVVFTASGNVSLPPSGPIQATLKGGGRLEPLNELAPLGEDRMGGSYNIDLAVGGTVANPQAGGSLTVDNGSYTNDASGMTLRKLRVKVTGQGRQFTLAELTAGDGGDGTLKASGSVDLEQAAAPRFDLKASLKSFTGARSDEVTAVLSGNASVTGSLAAPEVTGDLTIDRAEVNIPEQLPASYQKIAVIRIDSRHPMAASLVPPPPLPPPVVAALDIKIHDADQTFVRGDGLDSEWKGDLAIAGTSAAPVVTGELQSISGTFSILGKDFTLQRGVVDFLGSPVPVFDIQAQAQASDVTALVELQGTPDQPKLTLSSTPALPQDEVLSRIMFGSGTAQLTPVQGLQIASAAASLAGGGPGVLDRLRNYTGLDRLSLGSDNTNGATSTQGSGVGAGTSISGGKYVAPGVYVGVAQGLSGSSTRATMQVNVTPHVTVNATVGSGDNSGSSLGAQYQLDY